MRKLLLFSAVVLTACGGDGATSPRVASLSLSVPTPNVPVGQTVTLIARTVSSKGTPAAATGVTWKSLDPAVATVSSSGVVSAVAPGVATITATVAGQVANADVYVVAGSVSCSATAASAPAVGEIRLLSGAERTSLCIPATPNGSEYVLVGFNASPDTLARVSISATGQGVVPVTGAPTPSVATGGANLALAAAPLALDGPAAVSSIDGVSLTPDVRFHLALRARERAQLRAQLPAAGRALRADRGAPNFSVAPSPAGGLAPGAAPSLAKVPATKNALVRLNVQSTSGCERADYRGGRVVAVGARSIIVADTANPAGGFSEEQYARFAATFDSLVYPEDVRYFGEPGDIDDNGRSVIFFTRAVNELTPRNSDTYVGGFFFGRDLFPVAENRGEQYAGCAGSNEAELFYMLVPDPNGVVNGNRRSLTFVEGVTTGVLAHEFQHLINLSRRIDVNAPTEETVWLNEGLSHVAEEAMFFRASGLNPRQNIDAARVRSSERVRNAFNSYQGSNFGRLRAYLVNPEGNSPYAADDSIATRGATWQFLRYAVDRTASGGDETAVFRALVNSRLSGFQNLNAVFGGNALNLARDWSVAQYTDDANIGANLRTSYQFASWNYRDVYSALANSTGFPLAVKAVPASGLPVQSTVVAGGSTYLRFAAAPAAPATVRLTTGNAAALPSDVQLVLIRTR